MIKNKNDNKFQEMLCNVGNILLLHFTSILLLHSDIKTKTST